MFPIPPQSCPSPKVLTEAEEEESGSINTLLSIGGVGVSESVRETVGIKLLGRVS